MNMLKILQLHVSVIAQAQSLLLPGVCLSVRHVGLLYLDGWSLSSNFFLGPVARHSSFSTPIANTQFQVKPIQRGRKIHGVGKTSKSPFISETVRDRLMVAMKCK